jgi:hypothetical protein
MRLAVLSLFACSLAVTQGSAGGQKVPTADPVMVARSFLPPNAQLADDYSFDFRVGGVSKSWPAVLSGHIVGPDTLDIVFVYYSPQIHTMDKTLFVDLLHQTSSGYEKIYEISYRTQVLFGPKGLRLVHLRGVQEDAVAVMHGIGASLGGRLDIFLWHDLLGWKNVFPPDDSMHYFYFFPEKSDLEVALSASKHPGLNVSPPPVWYRWNGERFVKIPPPAESSK